MTFLSLYQCCMDDALTCLGELLDLYGNVRLLHNRGSGYLG